MHFCFTIPVNCKALTCCVNINYVLCHKWVISPLFQFIASILWVLIIFWCGYVMCRENLWSTICGCYSWEIMLSVSLDVLFCNMQDWKGIREKAHEVDSTKAYTTNDKTSQWILNVLYISVYMYIAHLHLWSGSHLHRIPYILQNASLLPAYNETLPPSIKYKLCSYTLLHSLCSSASCSKTILKFSL
jgi:hypothetical protein